ncbi:MAG: hypothetical protein AVDCRST_MAG59-5147, partial [uncultured Thermomicrobiales bacterium]
GRPRRAGRSTPDRDLRQHRWPHARHPPGRGRRRLAGRPPQPPPAASPLRGAAGDRDRRPGHLAPAAGVAAAGWHSPPLLAAARLARGRRPGADPARRLRGAAAADRGTGLRRPTRSVDRDGQPQRCRQFLLRPDRRRGKRQPRRRRNPPDRRRGRNRADAALRLRHAGARLFPGRRPGRRQGAGRPAGAAVAAGPDRRDGGDDPTPDRRLGAWSGDDRAALRFGDGGRAGTARRAVCGLARGRRRGAGVAALRRRRDHRRPGDADGAQRRRAAGDRRGGALPDPGQPGVARAGAAALREGDRPAAGRDPGGPPGRGGPARDRRGAAGDPADGHPLGRRRRAAAAAGGRLDGGPLVPGPNSGSHRRRLVGGDGGDV